MANVIPLQRFIAYMRVSTERQANENDSIDGQKQRIIAWAKANKIRITKFYVDAGNSAFKGSRPIFDTMLNDIEKRNVIVEGLIVYSFSRFSRNELTRMIAEERLQKFGVKLFSVTEQLPTDEDSAFLMKSIIGSVNEHQSRQNSRVVQDRLNETANKGYYTGGSTPIGYKSIAVDSNSQRVKKN